MNKNLERKKIEQIENLPTLPEVANKLLRIINDPLTTAHDVANLISRDLSLTSKVLRLANSAFYGVPRTVATVHNAVVILGLKVINTMVFSITVVKMFPADGRHELFPRRKFWSHSVAVAVLSKLLALRMRKFSLFDPEECFCAGLIHDVGRVVMDQYLHEEFIKAVKMAAADNMTLLEAEQKVFNFDHSDVGDWLTARWELPNDLRMPIIYHHRPAQATEAKEIVGVVHLADAMAHAMDFGMPKIKASPMPDAALIASLGLAEEDLEGAREEALGEIENLVAALEI
jgi:HD-like signal output (HDOD) protein